MSVSEANISRTDAPESDNVENNHRCKAFDELKINDERDLE